MGDRYRINAGRSRFTVQVLAEGLFSFFGHNPTIGIQALGGDVEFTPNSPEMPSLLVLVKTDSLRVISAANEKDRQEIEETMRREVLQIAKYPEAFFHSTRISTVTIGEGNYKATIDGNLSLHGVARSLELEANVTLKGDDLRATGEFTLRQADFNIERVSVAAGTLKVKEKVTLVFDVVAERQE